jgi:hypothetical protein
MGAPPGVRGRILSPRRRTVNRGELRRSSAPLHGEADRVLTLSAEEVDNRSQAHSKYRQSKEELPVMLKCICNQRSTSMPTLKARSSVF